MTVQQVLQIMLSGLTSGSSYALIALGLTLVFAVTKSLNLAQGEFATAAVFVAVGAISLGWPILVALVAAVLAAATLGLAVEWSTFHLPRHREALSRLLVSLAGVLVLHGAFLLIWGKNSVRLPSLPGPLIDVAGARISSQAMWLVGASALLGVGVPWYLNRSVRGLALRASADNPLGARLYGISVVRLSRSTFLAAAAIAAVGGVLSAPLILVRYDTGLSLTIKGFIAAVIGGIDRPSRALFGGLALGILEASGATLLPGQYKNVGIFFVLFLIVTYLPRLAGRESLS